MVQSEIFDRLSTLIGTDVGNRIYPTTATENTAVPFAVYTVTGTESIWTLAGPTGARWHTFTVDLFGIDQQTVLAIADNVINGLDGWESDVVRLCELQDANSQPLEFGHSYSCTFRILAQESSALLLETGGDIVTETDDDILLEA